MKKTFLSAALALTLAAPAMAGDPDRLVTVITSDQPQVQLMALVLTHQAIDSGHGSHILLCGAAGDMALKDAPESATAPQPPKGASPQMLMQGAIQKGATVEVCAIYLPGKGAEATALVDGVGVAQPPAMAGAITADDTIVWSF